MTVKFQSYDNQGKLIRGKFLKMALTLVYHPCNDPEHEQFAGHLDELLSSIPANTELLMGADINARIGVRDRSEFSSVLGPFGVAGQNDRGKNLAQLYSSQAL